MWFACKGKECGVRADLIVEGVISECPAQRHVKAALGPRDAMLERRLVVTSTTKVFSFETNMYSALYALRQPLSKRSTPGIDLYTYTDMDNERSQFY